MINSLVVDLNKKISARLEKPKKRELSFPTPFFLVALKKNHIIFFYNHQPMDHIYRVKV